MKRSLLGASGETFLKQPRRSRSSCLIVLSPTIDDENRSMNNNVEPAASSTASKNTLKQKNVDAETTGDLPLLTDSFINDVDSSTEVTKFKNRITELEEAKSKVEADYSFLKKRHEQVLEIKGNFNEKEKRDISGVYAEKKQYKRRAEKAEANILTLQDQVLKAKEKVKEKDVKRLEVQHKLNIVEDQLTVEKDAKEKALQDVKRLEDEVAKLNSNLGNKHDLIQHMNNKIKDGGQFITKEDTVTIAELQQTISSKDTTIFNLQKCLEEAYAARENLIDEKREAISEKENFMNRNNELREAAKTVKERISKLEKQLEDVHEKIGQRQNDIDQEYYEENESLKAQISTHKEAIKEKNQTIAQLQKDLNVAQVLYREEIEKVKAGIETLEAKLEDANLEHTEMLKKYTKIIAEFDRENSDAVEKMKKLESNIASLEEQLGDLSDTNSVILSEKQMVEKDLIISSQNEKQKADELAAEIREHEKTKEKKQIAQDFVDKAYEMNREEVARTAEANTKAAQFEAKFLQCQSKLAQEEENRQQLEAKLNASIEDLGNEIIERQNSITKNEELEKDKSQLIAELTDLKEKERNLQKKYDQMKADNAKQKENAANKYQKLEASNKTLIKSNENLKADFAAAKKDWAKNVAELEKVFQNFNSFCKK
uniref:Uncharacterized protein n=1 Tax=Panagrolaimus davidi TaxID=227884 RepID=A0A914PPD9_9BILA